MSNLYLISGCNGAGKTTSSLTVLPELLNCNEFVNADSIASGTKNEILNVFKKDIWEHLYIKINGTKN